MADGDMPLVKSYRGNEFEFGAVPNGNGNTTPNGMKNGKNNSRMSTLLFWQGRKGANGTTQNGKNWIHSQDALVNGHVAYLVKFLGCTAVDQPKGIEVVKDAITKLHFTQQLKKSETKEAAKCKKVEITISVDGVAIQEPKSTNIMYQFPLHRISYCADDKGAKKYFSFIAKGSNANNGTLNDSYENPDEKHQCFVFISTKLASEITLTIGQAFDLAYRRFLEDNGKYFEMQKLTLENKKLELQMNTYKNRLQELSKITYKDDLQSYLARNNIAEVAEFKVPEELQRQISALTIANGITGTPVNGLKADIAHDAQSNKSSSTQASADLLLSTPPPPSGRREKQPVVGTKLEGLLLNSDDDSDFDPRAEEESRPPTVSPPLLAPPPKATRRTSNNLQQQQQQTPAVNGRDLFGSTPFPVPSTIQPQNYASSQQFNPQTLSNLPNYDIIRDFKIETSVFNNNVTNDARSTSFTNLTGYDPFETQNGGNIFGNGYGNAFNGFGNLSEKPAVELDSNFNGFLDKRISEMKDGFSRGISFGNDNFSIDNLDPLKKN